MEKRLWTKKEEELLREFSKKYVVKTIAIKLNRSVKAIKHKALRLGIDLHSKKDQWEPWMINYIKDNINKKSMLEIQKFLGIGYKRLAAKCDEMGINYSKNYWTDEEIKILKEYAPKYHFTELTKVLPNRTVGAIAAKLSDLNIKHISTYVDIEDQKSQYIKDNWGKIPILEMARELKVSKSIIYRYKRVLKLPNIGHKKKWTQDIIENIRKDAKTKSREALAKKYKTSVQQISHIACKNNIKLIDSKIKYPKDLDTKLIFFVNQGFTIKEISNKLEIKADYLLKRIKKLGLVDNKMQKRWSMEQVELFKNLYLKKDVVELGRILNKSENQLKNKAKELDIHLIGVNYNRYWVEKDTDMLVKLSKTHNLTDISIIMNKSELTIIKKAKELNINLKYKGKTAFTSEEENKLLEYSKNYTLREIAEMLNRPVQSVRSKLKSMGLKPIVSQKYWTDEEKAQLYNLSKTNTIGEIAKIMNKSSSSIKNMLFKIGLKPRQERKNWTDEDINKLKELLETHSTFEISKLLNRSEAAISIKASELGLHINSSRKIWTKEEEEMLSELWGSVPIERICKKLNRTVSAVRCKISQLGLNSHMENNYMELKVKDIADIFQVSINNILTSWVSLGLKLKKTKMSNYRDYYTIQISDLYEFLKDNQNIWDSRKLDKHILGIEPGWLKQKRKDDTSIPHDILKLDNLTKQQLLKAKKICLELKNNNTTMEKDKNSKGTLTK